MEEERHTASDRLLRPLDEAVPGTLDVLVL